MNTKLHPLLFVSFSLKNFINRSILILFIFLSQCVSVSMAGKELKLKSPFSAGIRCVPPHLAVMNV